MPELQIHKTYAASNPADFRAYVNSSQCELTSRVRNFYGVLDGRFFPQVRYRMIMFMRTMYRKLHMAI